MLRLLQGEAISLRAEVSQLVRLGMNATETAERLAIIELTIAEILSGN